MQGNPAEFEAIGNRLGFLVVMETATDLRLVWRGPRFPAYLCLGIAVALLAISLPIIQAIHFRGFTGAAGSLWYFPLMNIVLFGIALYLVTQKRTIEIAGTQRRVMLRRHSLWRIHRLSVPFDEIDRLVLGTDRVESGFALGGSTAAQTYPVPSLRLVARMGASVLLDRGSKRRLEELAQRIATKIGRQVSNEEGDGAASARAD